MQNHRFLFQESIPIIIHRLTLPIAHPKVQSQNRCWGCPDSGAEMAQRRQPFEPDADNTAVGKHDKKTRFRIFSSGLPFWASLF